MDSNLFCYICSSAYTDDSAKPNTPMVSTACGHTFCLNCSNLSKNQRNEIFCPFCKKHYPSENHKKNITLAQLASEKQSNFCKSHNKYMDLVCEDCRIKICYKCEIDSHSDHKTEDISIFVDEAQKRIGDLSSVVDKANKSLIYMESLSKTRREILHNLVDLRFDHEIKLLNESRKKAKREIDEKINELSKDSDMKIRSSDNKEILVETLHKEIERLVTNSKNSDKIDFSLEFLKSEVFQLKSQIIKWFESDRISSVQKKLSGINIKFEEVFNHDQFCKIQITSDPNEINYELKDPFFSGVIEDWKKKCIHDIHFKIGKDTKVKYLLPLLWNSETLIKKDLGMQITSAGSFALTPLSFVCNRLCMLDFFFREDKLTKNDFIDIRDFLNCTENLQYLSFNFKNNNSNEQILPLSTSFQNLRKLEKMIVIFEEMSNLDKRTINLFFEKTKWLPKLKTIIFHLSRSSNISSFNPDEDLNEYLPAGISKYELRLKELPFTDSSTLKKLPRFTNLQFLNLSLEIAPMPDFSSNFSNVIKKLKSLINFKLYINGLPSLSRAEFDNFQSIWQEISYLKLSELKLMFKDVDLKAINPEKLFQCIGHSNNPLNTFSLSCFVHGRKIYFESSIFEAMFSSISSLVNLQSFSLGIISNVPLRYQNKFVTIPKINHRIKHFSINYILDLEDLLNISQTAAEEDLSSMDSLELKCVLEKYNKSEQEQLLAEVKRNFTKNANKIKFELKDTQDHKIL